MPDPVRVLLMVRTLDLGGSERQLSVLAQNLDPAAFEVHVGCLRAGGARFRDLRSAGVPIVEFPVSSFVRPSVAGGALRLIRYLAEHRIQIVHTFDWPMNLFGASVARAAGGVIVVTSQRAHRELSPGLPRHLLRVTDQFSDAIVVNSDFVRRHLVNEERAPAGKIRLCYNGIDLAAFSPEPREKPAEFGGAALVVGVVCALRPEKGLACLLDAFGRVAPRRPGIRLAIVGDGPSLPDLRNQADGLGIADRCVFVPAAGFVVPFLRGIDIFVLPSLSEAFSNALMEAMACGCCAIASRVGGNPELVSDGETGLLFPAGDPEALADRIRSLADDASVRQRLSGAGARFIHANFSQEASARTMAEIYRSLLER
ncbi:MAG: glycosyltransferase [Bryobacteraceae bacterium]|nr:glycosyltransferase [Bryobacteraceae bacterium]